MLKLGPPPSCTEPTTNPEHRGRNASTMVARIPYRSDTTTGEVARWVWDQAPFMPGPSHQHVLLYLALNAFVRADNEEGEDVGVVMESRSYWSAIKEATRLGRSSIDRALVDLQNMGYIIRRQRDGRGGNLAPHIHVMWSEDDDNFRRDLRSGKKHLPTSVVWQRKPVKRVLQPENVVAFPTASNN